MNQMKVVIETHWLNGWFLRLFATPYVVTGSAEQEARWGATATVPAGGDREGVGVGVRYFNRGSLLGLEKVMVALPQSGATTLVFRNGFWNHDPFRLVRTVPASA